MKYQIGIIVGGFPGAGEAVGAALEVLGVLGAEVAAREFDIGAARYLRTGELLPAEDLAELRGMDAVFCGSPPASADPAIPPGTLERGIVFGLRRELGLHVNLRIFQGVGPRSEVGVAVVRENSEGAYAAVGATLHEGSADEIATEVGVSSRAATERCVRFAFDLARTRRSRVTLAHKTRVLLASGGLWERTAAAVAREYPDVTLTVENVDTCCARMIDEPGRYDVVVTDNVFGDIVSDVACAVARAAPYSASSELGDGPSLFEPMHGAADRPVSTLAAVGAAAAMLTHLGEPAAGDALSRAVLAAAAAGSADVEKICAEAIELMEGH